MSRKLDAVNRDFIHLQGLGPSQFAVHLVNEINQGPCYVNDLILYVVALIFGRGPSIIDVNSEGEGGIIPKRQLKLNSST